MTHIATKHLTLAFIVIIVASLFAVYIPRASATVTFTFHGPYEEGTAVLLDSNCTLVIHTTTGTNLTYSFKQSSYALSPGVNPQYFEYIYNYTGNSYHRYYWLDDAEVTGGGDFYVYFSESLTPIAFSIFGYSTLSGNFDGGAYLIVKSAGGIPAYVIEKIPVDSLGDVVAILKANTPYDLTVKADGSTSSYTFGNIATVSTAITLRIPPSAFPEESLLQYPYVTFYGYRDFDLNSIVLLYNDTKEETNSLSLSIVDDGGTTVYSYSVNATDNVGVTWPSAVDSTTYYVNIDVDHALYGDLSWKQTFYAEGASDNAIFSFDFLGDRRFDLVLLYEQ